MAKISTKEYINSHIKLTHKLVKKAIKKYTEEELDQQISRIFNILISHLENMDKILKLNND